MASPEIDPEIERMAAKASRLRRFGKSVADLTDIELKAAIWKSVSTELDAYQARLTPILDALENVVREIETAGFALTLTRTGDVGMASYDGEIDLLPPVEG